MIFEQILSGGDRNYGYLVACENTKQAAVIDPSPDPRSCYRRAEELGLTVKYVINTHTHYDHTGGNAFFQREVGAQLVTYKTASSGDVKVGEGDTLALGDVTLSFSTYGRKDAETEFASLKKLMELDDDVRVWPGHNYGVRPTSTIGEEKKNNPFILRLNKFDDFFWLKENWAAYKLEHGIA
jgi:glyoxylase-like metal-dependent hydrolase (beta-lactamase superfamily II)